MLLFCLLNSTEIPLASTDGLDNSSYLSDSSDGTCVPVNLTSNNPPTLHIQHSNFFKKIKLQIVFKNSTICSNNEIFYVNSPSLSKQGCSTPILRKCKYIVTQTTEGKLCNYKCQCPGDITCDILITNLSGLNLNGLEICDIFIYTT